MHRLLIALPLAGSLAFGFIPAVSAQSGAAQHLAAAKVAAGKDHPGLFDRICAPGAVTGGAPAAARAGGAPPPPQAPPPVSEWHAEPAKVFDNLYFVGMTEYSAWAITTSQGIILADAVFDYSVEDAVVNGLKKLGLDPAQIKYVLISHAHTDHAGGAKLLQQRYGSRVILSAADWDLLDRQNPSWKPKRDMVATDGMKLTVGDASIQVVTMPGHTAGTLSYLFEVKDNGKPMRIAYVGGTAIPYDGDAAYYDLYLASSRKVAKAAADYGATVMLSNHTEFDNGYYKAHTAAMRKPGEANPFDVGKAGVAGYFSVVDYCVSAAKLRATGKL